MKVKKQTIEELLKDGFRRYERWLVERIFEGKLKHKKIKAYRNIKKNLNKLYTYEKYPELSIPKTDYLLVIIAIQFVH